MASAVERAQTLLGEIQAALFERALAFRSRLVKAMGLGAADFQHLREELVKLRANLTDAQ